MVRQASFFPHYNNKNVISCDLTSGLLLRTKIYSAFIWQKALSISSRQLIIGGLDVMHLFHHIVGTCKNTLKFQYSDFSWKPSQSLSCFSSFVGSGKTYTMQPLPLRASQDIFRLMHHTYRNQGFQLFVSFFEIYGGKLFDLLNDRK